jgi:radical SAM superfamily enzyme YgiQ (UPF0313 family)
MDGRYYTRDIDAVVEELRTISESNVFFVDDEPFINPKRMRFLAKKIEDSGLEKNYFAYCRMDSMVKNVDLMKQWQAIGLKRLFIGVETIFDNEAAGYNKQQNRDQILQGLQAAADLGIHLLCSFIIHPDYTEKEFDELIEFIRKSGVEHPCFTVWTPLPGTDYDDNEILVRQPNGRPDWDYFDLQQPVTKTRLPKEEFLQRFQNLYRIFYNEYAASHMPGLAEDIKKYKAALQDSYAALAANVLGLNKRPSESD